MGLIDRAARARPTLVGRRIAADRVTAVIDALATEGHGRDPTAVAEAKVASGPQVIIAVLLSFKRSIKRVGLEAGLLS